MRRSFCPLCALGGSGGKGRHTGFLFENIRLENWYSLTQILQPNPAIENVQFRRIWAMDGPGMVPSRLQGSIDEVSFRSVDLGGVVPDDRSLPIRVADGAAEPVYGDALAQADYNYTQGLIQPGQDVTFTAQGGAPTQAAAKAPAKDALHFHWIFGDGTTADGRMVHHAFADTEGTLLDGSGRFRVLLSVTEGTGAQAWSSQSTVVARTLHPAMPESPQTTKAAERKGSQSQSQSLAAMAQSNSAESPTVSQKRGGVVYEAALQIPAAGGYTLTLLTSTTAALALDGIRVESAALRPQV